MPLYQVLLARTFIVKVQAQSAEEAGELAQFFVGSNDDSNEQERKENQFRFREIELVDNDVMEVNRIEN